MDSFVFIYGIGILLVFSAIVPLQRSFRKPLLIVGDYLCDFWTAATGYSVAVLTCGISTRDRLGLRKFVNDRLRVVSFSDRRPGSLNCLVVISLLILNKLLVGDAVRGVARGRAFLWTGYITCVILIVNTYSRAGYVLFVTTSIVLVLSRRGYVRGGSIGRLGSYLISVLAGGTVLLLALDKIPFDRSVLDTTSYISRQDNWASLIQRVYQGSVLDLFVGFGVSARFPRGDPRYFIIDNLWFALFLYGGILSLLGTSLMSVVVVRYALSVQRAGDRSLGPWIVLIPGLWVEGAFVDNHNTLFVCLLLILGLVSSAQRRIALSEGVGIAKGPLRAMRALRT